jgi:hypothetical protein
LNAITCGEFVRYFPVHIDANEATRIVVDDLSRRFLDSQHVRGGIDAHYCSILTCFDPHGLASARISDDIVEFVATGPGAFGTCHFLTLDEHTDTVVLRRKCSVGFQLLAHGSVQLASGGIVG